MDSFNKIISFILGLVVVVVFLAVITGRLNLGKRFSSLSSSTISPTPTTSSAVPTPTTVINNYQSQSHSQADNQSGKTPGVIPATGAPTVLLPLALFGLFSGFGLKKAGKK